ncbi:osteopetrosis-associated transmembrane protein 1 [Phyllopteryx taeniolatus]|uniref:osteopetrosis-associated transmembrane protein 1 n=1 Tax=Phyllopteryx taeniolatus TaxID=161469 RepID=UPI002AD39951|nr:osteopetrosis-associated transmembrane protein 1 [Phyllopteryx taeniolatus]
MPLSHHNAFLTAWVLYVCAVASSEGANATLSVSPAVESPVVKPAAAPVSLLLSAFPDDLEVSDYCSELLRLFGQRYVAYVNCLVPAARPVKVCQNCFGAYGSLVTTYMNISSEQSAPGNESCRDSLLRSDRLMLVYLLFDNLQDLWTKAACDNCINDGFRSLTDDTLYFMSILNQTLTCFERYQQGNHTELCKNCKSAYKGLNELYSGMEKNGTMCIDIEDGMNMTRRLWSKNFKCSLPREETVPVIAVSSFMLFLPIIFYLSSFLHSEQKKRKLIHPKRAKSYASSLMNIRDKRS